MSNLSYVKRGMIIGAHLAGASASITANLLSASRTTVLRDTTAYTNMGKVSSTKHNSGRKSKLKYCDRRMLKTIVTQKRKTTQPQMNTHL
ncbi:transposable element Tc1 transposase [Trichonephila clavipes]|nr:transposable element Tc1 transposase [Trichonephila clavipes]